MLHKIAILAILAILVVMMPFFFKNLHNGEQGGFNPSILIQGPNIRAMRYDESRIATKLIDTSWPFNYISI